MAKGTWRRRISLVIGCATLTGCHLSDVLKVAVPAGVSSSSGLANQSGAEGVFATGEAQLFEAVYGNGALIQWTSLLGDEFAYAGFTYSASQANIDARRTVAVSGFQETSDYLWENVLQARTTLLFAIPELEKYEPASGLSKAGEAYALTGYAELFVAESFCGGTPLSEILPTGGTRFGVPLADDSLLGVAEEHFDSALAYSGGNDTVSNLAAVGLGRTLLDRGRFDSAAAAVQNVAATFVYNSTMESNTSAGYYNLNLYANNVQYPGAIFTAANQKGQNGLNFVAANDPRLLFNTQEQTQDGMYGGAVPGTWYVPEKFMANLAVIPVATGVEAALIRAEGALHDGDVSGWLTDLNALRNTSCSVPSPGDTTCTLGTGQVTGQTAGLPSLTDPGTDTGRVSLMFRERAFWLYGTGSRLGDLRRLMRAPYNRDSSLVFPRGPYPNGTSVELPAPIPTYGTDVNLTLPTETEIKAGFTETNPNYKGCITSTTQP